MRRGAGRRLRESARHARREAALLLPLLVAVLLVYHYRERLFGADEPVRVGCAIALLYLGWRLARDLGQAAAPLRVDRLEPATAGVLRFLIRLVFVIVAATVAFRVAGIEPEQLALGGAVTVVVVGLAAQGTIGNVFAGVLLLAARPFKVGDRVRLQAGGLAGQLEGVVSSLGLLYVVLVQGEDTIMVPNSVVLTAAIVPLREPASVDVRARFEPGARPSRLQAYLERSITVPTRAPVQIELEEVSRDEVVMRVRATPELDREGAKLADEILEALERVTRASGRPSHPGGGRRAGAGRAQEQEEAERQPDDPDDHQHQSGRVDPEPVDPLVHRELEDRADGDDEKARPDPHAEVVRPSG
jgi:small-conductance mechanosensitive channel